MANFEETGLEAVIKGVGRYTANASKVVTSNNAITKSVNAAGAASMRLAGALGTAIRTGGLIAVVATAAVGVAALKMAANFETAFAEVTTLFEAP